LAPKAPEVISVAHLHSPTVSVAEQLLIVRGQLLRSGTATFRALTAGCEHTLEVVARFLALLDLYRQQRVSFEQLTPMGELHVRWTGGPGADDDPGRMPDGADVGPDAVGGTDVDEEYG
jgi:segregation and condensation protein A